MALTGMQIYKYLPKTNCKDCGIPTCMAFAMQVAAKKRAITNCPHLSAQAESDLAEASSPPMKLVTIGAGDRAFVFGQETVLFRHEEKFHRKSGIAVRIRSSMSDEEAGKVGLRLKESVFERVGEKLRVALAFVELDGTSDPASRAIAVSDASGLPVILSTTDPVTAEKAAMALADKRPLLYMATSDSVDAFADIALKSGAALAIGSGSLEELADLVSRARAKGVENIVLAFDGKKGGETIRNLTIARRSALKKQFRSLGYPSIVDCGAATPELEALVASGFAAKYGGIVVVNHAEDWELVSIMTLVQDVYRDPQVPNMVEAKLYEIGNPGPDSPVIFTTNFSLTSRPRDSAYSMRTRATKYPSKRS
jgi:acetyl-CoA decarbonylase/synthase complex subunit gamma